MQYSTSSMYIGIHLRCSTAHKRHLGTTYGAVQHIKVHIGLRLQCSTVEFSTYTLVVQYSRVSCIWVYTYSAVQYSKVRYITVQHKQLCTEGL